MNIYIVMRDTRHDTRDVVTVWITLGDAQRACQTERNNTNDNDISYYVVQYRAGYDGFVTIHVS